MELCPDWDTRPRVKDDRHLSAEEKDAKRKQEASENKAKSRQRQQDVKQGIIPPKTVKAGKRNTFYNAPIKYKFVASRVDEMQSTVQGEYKTVKDDLYLLMG